MKQILFILFFVVLGLSSFGANNEPDVSLYPVPLRTNILNVQLTSTVSTKAVSVELRNFIGRKLQTKQTGGKGLVEFVDMSQYPEGVYVVLVKDGNGKILETAKFMIAK